MGYGYDGGGVWMWVFGGLMMVGVLLVIGVVVWAIMAATPAATPPPPRRPIRADGRGPGRCWTSGTPR